MYVLVNVDLRNIYYIFHRRKNSSQLCIAYLTSRSATPTFALISLSDKEFNQNGSLMSFFTLPYSHANFLRYSWFISYSWWVNFVSSICTTSGMYMFTRYTFLKVYNATMFMIALAEVNQCQDRCVHCRHCENYGLLLNPYISPIVFIWVSNYVKKHDDIKIIWTIKFLIYMEMFKVTNLIWPFRVIEVCPPKLDSGDCWHFIPLSSRASSFLPRTTQWMLMSKYVVAHITRKVGVGIGVIEGIVHFRLTQTIYTASIKSCLHKDDVLTNPRCLYLWLYVVQT